MDKTLSNRIYKPYKILETDKKSNDKYTIIPTLDMEEQDIFSMDTFGSKKQTSNTQVGSQNSVSKTESGYISSIHPTFTNSKLRNFSNQKINTNMMKIKSIKKNLKKLKSTKFTGLYTPKIHKRRRSAESSTLHKPLKSHSGHQS